MCFRRPFSQIVAPFVDTSSTIVFSLSDETKSKMDEYFSRIEIQSNLQRDFISFFQKAGVNFDFSYVEDDRKKDKRFKIIHDELTNKTLDYYRDTKLMQSHYLGFLNSVIMNYFCLTRKTDLDFSVYRVNLELKQTQCPKEFDLIINFDFVDFNLKAFRPWLIE